MRKTEGLMASLLTLMNLTVFAPDHTMDCRRAVRLPIMKSASTSNGPLHVLSDRSGQAWNRSRIGS
ncbi:transposase [Actimicrobium sp. CCI2.3]|uniref:transposase n=1 Tax=Actimicrobium sp. CCI2.3 TaxID=3048616 RepID=UPI003A101ED8